MLTTAQKLAVVLVAMVIAFGTAWQIQARRYAALIARQATLKADDLNNLTQAALGQQQAEQDNRPGN